MVKGFKAIFCFYLQIFLAALTACSSQTQTLPTYEGRFTPEQAEAFLTIHDKLPSAGLMQ